MRPSLRDQAAIEEEQQSRGKNTHIDKVYESDYQFMEGNNPGLVYRTHRYPGTPRSVRSIWGTTFSAKCANHRQCRASDNYAINAIIAAIFRYSRKNFYSLLPVKNPKTITGHKPAAKPSTGSVELLAASPEHFHPKMANTRWRK